MNFQAKVSHAFDWIIGFLAFLAATLIILVMLLVGMEIVLRYGGSPMAWAFEVTEYCLLFITFLGTAWVLRNERHVTMDLVPN